LAAEKFSFLPAVLGSGSAARRPRDQFRLSQAGADEPLYQSPLCGSGTGQAVVACRARTQDAPAVIGRAGRRDAEPRIDNLRR
jgi:hypothetical protein